MHFLQGWIEPKFKGVRPRYDEKHVEAASRKGQLRLIVSPDGRDGANRPESASGVESFARTLAINLPEDMTVNEIVFRPNPSERKRRRRDGT